MINNFPKPKAISNLSEMKARLESAREEGDIYLVARSFQVLSHAGEEVSLTASELEQMHNELENVRKGVVEDFFSKVPGYMVARWLMILNDIAAGTVQVTDEDINTINNAAATYIADEEYHQIASLVLTGRLIGVEVDTKSLNSEGISEVARHIEEMESGSSK